MNDDYQSINRSHRLSGKPVKATVLKVTTIDEIVTQVIAKKAQNQIARRDLLTAIGRRASKLNREQAADAWANLAEQLEAMWERDLPKFKDLVDAIRTATITGRVPKKLPK